jgi:hypothetical protein
MPTSYFIDPVRRLVIIAADGVLTGAELLAEQRHLASEPQFQRDFSQLFDLTRVTEAQVSAEDIRAMASTTAFGPAARRALIVAEPLLYGLSRMFQLMLDDRGGTLRIFTDRSEAEAWLGVRPLD